LSFGNAGQLAAPMLFGAVFFAFGYQAAYMALGLPVIAVAVVMLRRKEGTPVESITSR